MEISTEILAVMLIRLGYGVIGLILGVVLTLSIASVAGDEFTTATHEYKHASVWKGGSKGVDKALNANAEGGWELIAVADGIAYYGRKK